MRRSFLNNNEKGITLIALIITIIVMLILAGVTINLTLGENGIFTTAQKAVQNHMDAQDKEIAELGKFENTINETINGLNTNINDEQEELDAGLYDANGVMLCTWEDSGIDITIDYVNSTSASNHYSSTPTSPYYVLKNVYPTATQIVIPDSVTSIGKSAFYSCSKLTSITIPEGVTSIGKNAFFSCSKLTSITIPEGVTSIEEICSNCSNLKKITIPENVTSIKNGAFNNCTNLISIVIAEENTVYDSRNNCNAIIETDTNTLILGCQNTIIPDSVTSIGDYAFSHCNKLTNIKIPESVTNIGNYSFQYCKNLTSIVIPKGVTTIGISAFSNCTGLTETIIPENVTSIHNSAFKNCKNLTSIVIAEKNTVYDSRNNCNAIIETDSNTLILGCKNTEIPESVTSIGNSAFFYCSELTSIVIPEGVTMIGSQAFAECRNITSIEIPESVTSIGNSAFSCCIGLTSIEIPESVTSIGNSAFNSCSKLTSMVIPENVTSIGYGVFKNCSKLTSIIFVDTDTWYIKPSSGTGTIKMSVTDSTKNVTYFKDTYSTWIWTKQ